MHKKTWVAIIAGGQGTRLFPISNPERPKQFCQLDKENTFIQSVIEHFLDIGIDATRIAILTTNKEQTQLAEEQVLSRGILSQNIFEISPRYNYSGAMVKAAEIIAGIEKTEDVVIINTPSDQYVETKDGKFKKTIRASVELAEKDEAVIVGVKVNDIVEAMGCGHVLYKEGKEICQDVIAFEEKPCRERADELMRKGNSVCNTGINVWKASRLLKTVRSDDIKDGLATDILMQKLGKLKVAIGTFAWHDCGTLKSLYAVSAKTPKDKNAVLGNGTFERIDCHKSLLYAEEGMELRVAGAKDEAIIFTTINNRPILVISKLSESQRIKGLAENFDEHATYLTDDFSFKARNNTVLRSNISEDLIVGFVAVDNYAVYAHKLADGKLEAVVSQQLQFPS